MKSVFVTLCLIAMIVAPSFCLQHKTMSAASKMQLEKIRAMKGTWASFMVDLAQVHLTSGGPLDQLVDAIEEVIVDLQAKLQKAHENYDKRTNDHNSEVSRIQDLITSAESDIASTSEFLELLAVQRQTLLQDITNYERSIEQNIHATEESISLRNVQHEAYLAAVPEHEDAIAALSEALEVLSQLHEQGAIASLAQIKKVQKNVDVLNQKLKKGQDKAFINALMELAANSKFADQGALQRVEQIMREVQQNLSNALQTLHETEASQVAQHATDLENFRNELNALNLALADTRANLVVTEERIADNEEFLAQRQADKVAAEQALVDENESFARDTEAYHKLIEQFEHELAACEAALEHLANSQIADFIGGRMEQDVIISQPHGIGITVEA